MPGNFHHISIDVELFSNSKIIARRMKTRVFFSNLFDLRTLIEIIPKRFNVQGSVLTIELMILRKKLNGRILCGKHNRFIKS